MIVDAETLELSNSIESLLEALGETSAVKPELMESRLRDRDGAVPQHARGWAPAARAAQARADDRRGPRPRDRLGRHAPVRDVGGPADRRAPALPRPDRRAPVRRAPGADLRRARARGRGRPGQGGLRGQRHARARAAPARAVGELALLARGRDAPALHAHADLPRVPARRDPAALRGLGRLPAPDRVHGRVAHDRGLHLPLVRRPAAPELRHGRDPRDGRADAGRAHARRSRRSSRRW